MSISYDDVDGENVQVTNPAVGRHRLIVIKTHHSEDGPKFLFKLVLSLKSQKLYHFSVTLGISLLRKKGPWNTHTLGHSVSLLQTGLCATGLWRFGSRSMAFAARDQRWPAPWGARAPRI